MPPGCRTGQAQPGEVGRSSCRSGAKETGAGAGTCSTAAPRVKVNLKPGPSRLSKQKQRLAQADEYSLPPETQSQRPCIYPEARVLLRPPAWRRESQGKSRVGEHGNLSPQFPHSRVSGCTRQLRPRSPSPISSSKETPTPLQHGPPPGHCPGHCWERVKGRCSL